MLRVYGPIRPTSGACATTVAARGGKRLISWRSQAILTSEGTPLGECRLITNKSLRYENTSAFRKILTTDSAALRAISYLTDQPSHASEFFNMFMRKIAKFIFFIIILYFVPTFIFKRVIFNTLNVAIPVPTLPSATETVRSCCNRTPASASSVISL
jgi:hypothetical protein